MIMFATGVSQMVPWVDGRGGQRCSATYSRWCWLSHWISLVCKTTATLNNNNIHNNIIILSNFNYNLYTQYLYFPPINAPINAKPHPPPPGTGGDLSIWRCKGLAPEAILFDKPLANTPGHDSFTSTILVYRQTDRWYTDFTKFPPPGLGFTDKAPPCPGRGVVGLCIDRCIILLSNFKYYWLCWSWICRYYKEGSKVEVGLAFTIIIYIQTENGHTQCCQGW